MRKQAELKLLQAVMMIVHQPIEVRADGTVGVQACLFKDLMESYRGVLSEIDDDCRKQLISKERHHV